MAVCLQPQLGAAECREGELQNLIRAAGIGTRSTASPERLQEGGELVL